MRICTIFLTLISFALTSCARYSAKPLAELHPKLYVTDNEEIFVACHALTRAECRAFFDRDIIGQGYQPVQIAITNKSGATYVLRRESLSLVTAPPEHVASLVYTSTVGRVVAYGIGGLFFFPLWVPAIVDGYGSAEANRKLDADFREKSLQEVQLIPPRSVLSKVVFVPMNQREREVRLSLVDAMSDDTVDIDVPIR
jgi:hypothetical protein